MSYEIFIPKTFDSLFEGVKFWEKNKENEKIELEKKINAIHSIKEAVTVTKGYLYDVNQGNTSRDKELTLAATWQKASEIIWAYDRDLFNISEVKALGWADPREWDKREQMVSTVKLDDIIKQCNFRLDELNQPR